MKGTFWDVTEINAKEIEIRVTAHMTEPAGSQAPMTANENKWFNGVSAEGLNKLSEIAYEVERTAEKAITDLVRAKLKIGRLMNEAREIFPGDRQFGQWRQQALPQISTTEATYCMKAANKFENAPDLIQKMGWSAMRELAYAPDELVRQLEADDREKLSRKDVREARQAYDAPDTPEDGHGGATGDAEAYDPVPMYRGDDTPEGDAPEGDGDTYEWNRVEGVQGTETGRIEGGMRTSTAEPERGMRTSTVQVGIKKYPKLTIEERWEYYLSLRANERVDRAKEYDEDPFIIAGLAPDTEISCISPDTLDWIVFGLKSEMEMSPDTIRPDVYDKIINALGAVSRMITESHRKIHDNVFKQRIEAEGK